MNHFTNFNLKTTIYYYLMIPCTSWNESIANIMSSCCTNVYHHIFTNFTIICQIVTNRYDIIRCLSISFVVCTAERILSLLSIDLFIREVQST